MGLSIDGQIKTSTSYGIRPKELKNNHAYINGFESINQPIGDSVEISSKPKFSNEELNQMFLIAGIPIDDGAGTQVVANTKEFGDESNIANLIFALS